MDWALHVDEGTPHIHERHVFDCENKYGEICPQQEKALEKMGIPLPEPDRTERKTNNRKKTFDVMCRELLLDICDNRKLYLDKVLEYVGRDYLEKQDYILMKQKEQMAAQKVLNVVKTTMMNPKVKAEGKEEIKKKAKSSVLDKLYQHRDAIANRRTDTDRIKLKRVTEDFDL